MKIEEEDELENKREANLFWTSLHFKLSQNVSIQFISKLFK